jgi:heterodisulfide reductase subunit C
MTSNDTEQLEDFLEVDQKIPGQNYCCISFISPEKIIDQKNIYNMSHFLTYVLGNELEDEDQERIRQSTISNIKSVVKKEGGLTPVSTKGFYENWLYTKEEKLATDFNESIDFQTSTRGVKVRGVYDTLREAQVRAKILQKRDKNFHVYVGQLGYWLPWDPSPDSIENQEYQEGQLNQLMDKYNENCATREDFYEKDKQDKMKMAREENRKVNNSERSEFQLNTTQDKEKIDNIRTITDTKLGYNVEDKAKNNVSKEFDSLTGQDPWLERKMTKDDSMTIGKQ